MNLPQNVVFLHHYEEEKDFQSGETHLSHWNQMCQETRVSDQKKSPYWAEMVYDLSQHVVKTCSFCNSTKPRPDRSPVSGLRAEEFGDLIFSDDGSIKNGDKTFGFLIVLNGATSHLTTHPCKSTSPSEVTSKFFEGRDTFQMNPEAICADLAFHHPHDIAGILPNA